MYRDNRVKIISPSRSSIAFLQGNDYQKPLIKSPVKKMISILDDIKYIPSKLPNYFGNEDYLDLRDAPTVSNIIGLFNSKMRNLIPLVRLFLITYNKTSKEELNELINLTNELVKSIVLMKDYFNQRLAITNEYPKIRSSIRGMIEYTIEYTDQMFHIFKSKGLQTK